MNARWAGAVTGMVTAAVAVGAAELAAVVTGPGTAPLVAVGSAVVDSAPEPVVRFAIEVFGGANRTVLQIGILVLLLAVAAAVGVASLRRRWVGLVGLAGFAAVGVAAAVTRHDAPAVAWLPTVVGAVVAAVVFLVLHRLATGPVTAADDAVPPPTAERRALLRYAVLTGGAAVLAGVVGR